MKVKVEIQPDNKVIDIDIDKDSAIVTDVLLKLNIKPDTVIVIKKNIPIPIDENIENGDKLKIIRVASGG
jgi:sulfur carrier protein ThiS